MERDDATPSPLIEILNDIEEYLEQRHDVRDGSDGVQLPNEEMSLLGRLAHARTLWARSSLSETATLAPHHPDAEVKRFYESWWGEQTLKGDPMLRPRLTQDAFLAGFRKANESEYSRLSARVASDLLPGLRYAFDNLGLDEIGRVSVINKIRELEAKNGA